MPHHSSASATSTTWTHEFDTIRRENLFRNPPKDHTAYPALKAAIAPHVESFNALFGKDGLIAQGLLDIGTKTYLDGDEKAGPLRTNKLTIKIKEVFVEKSMLPPSNKFSIRNREMPRTTCHIPGEDECPVRVPDQQWGPKRVYAGPRTDPSDVDGEWHPIGTGLASY
jgi:DNA-directed RNA polymerase I subunit RPA2